LGFTDADIERNERPSSLAIASAYFEAANNRNLAGVDFCDNNRRNKLSDGRAICSSAMIRDFAGRRVSITINRHAVSGDSRDNGSSNEKAG